MVRVLRRLLAAAACVVLLAAGAPADATFGPGSGSGAGDTSARPGFVRGQITFTYDDHDRLVRAVNQNDPADSPIIHTYVYDCH